MTGPARLRVVYLVGAQNCGSTLLDAILGNAPGAFSLGEVGGFHRYQSATTCDCGEAPAACGPCQSVVSALSVSGDLATFPNVSRLPLKERRAHWTLVATRGRASYARVADVMLSGVAQATGSHTLVDSSKNVGRAAALVHDSGHDVRVVHLVRDGRAYQRSRRRRAEADGRRYRPNVALGSWTAKNVLIWGLLRPRIAPDRYLLCRYEDLVADPETTLGRIGAFTGLDTGGLAGAATGEGLDRTHLFEPPRRLDYRRVRLDAGRLGSERISAAANARWWTRGGFVSSLWGYDRSQSYLDGHDGADGAPTNDVVAG